MKKLWYAILDFFHIEHHPRGTMRVVQMADGKFLVQEWIDDDYYGGDWHWERVRLPGTGKYSGRYDTLAGAMELYNRIQDERTDRDQAQTIVLVHAQEDV